MIKVKRLISNKTHIVTDWPIKVLSAFVFLYAFFIAFKYGHQIPLDSYSFRQTQTALTAYWFVKDGFSFAYQTPVAGPPWSIPFEFPIYQFFVALLVKLFSCSLDFAGRMTSFIFLALSCISAHSIIKSLKLKVEVFYIFVALLFSSPLYLYWGRSFMIETAAIFFAVTAIKYFVDILQEKYEKKSRLFFVIFMALGILQKVTTGLPVLFVLVCTYFTVMLHKEKSLSRVFNDKNTHLSLICFLVPLGIGFLWTFYTDYVKSFNELGVSLTSNALTSWNFGSVNQRLSLIFYDELIWKRIFEQNLSGLLGLSLIVIAIFYKSLEVSKLTIIISFFMGILPLYIFSNLHIVHSYYQAGNVIFLIFAIAIALGHILFEILESKLIIYLILLMMLVSNYFHFGKDYFGLIRVEYNKENSREFAVAKKIKEVVNKNNYFVAFGNDWSSSLSYLSERKSFTVPQWFTHYKSISDNPERFISEQRLGAVVLCEPLPSPTVKDLDQWASLKRTWKIGVINSCFIATPENSLSSKILSGVQDVSCQGAIDEVKTIDMTNKKLMSVRGWTTVLGEKGIVPDRVYISLSDDKGSTIYLESMHINRPDVNAHFGLDNEIDIGFSRLVNVSSFKGKYRLGVLRMYRGRFEKCQFNKHVIFDGDV